MLWQEQVKCSSNLTVLSLCSCISLCKFVCTSSVQVFVYVKCARSRCHVGDFHQRQPPRGLWFQIWDFHLENLDFKVFLFLFVCFIVQASTGIFIQEFSILNNLILSNFFLLVCFIVQGSTGGWWKFSPAAGEFWI